MQECDVRLVALRSTYLEKLGALDIQVLESFLPDVGEAIVSKPSDNPVKRPLEVMRRDGHIGRGLLARLRDRLRMRFREGNHVRGRG